MMKENKLKKLLTVVLMVSMFMSVFSFPVGVSAQNSDVTEYSSAAEWIQNIDIEEWAEELEVATYSNVDEWTENAAVAEWAEESDILSYADDIVYAYEYEQTPEQVQVSGEIDATVIVHADGTDEIICQFSFDLNPTAQTRGFGDGDSETKLLNTSLSGDGNGNLTVKAWWTPSKPTLNYRLKMELYYGTCRVEKPNNLKASTDYLTSIGTASSPSTLKTSIGTTKYFMIRIKGDGWISSGSQDSINYLFNKKAVKYPEYTNPHSKIYCVPPYYANTAWVSASNRVKWTTTDRDNYKKWYEQKYGKPSFNWSDYDIHHILPKEYGGQNNNSNLCPVLRTTHYTFNSWWNNFS